MRGWLISQSAGEASEDAIKVTSRGITLGRATNANGPCDVDYICNGDKVSRKHCRISPNMSLPTGFEIVDLGTPNGTFINGVRMHDAWSSLKHEDVVSLANQDTFKFVIRSSVEAIRDSVMRQFKRKRQSGSGNAGWLLQQMWSDRAFCDASIQCEGASVMVHRAVITAASPVFDAMFKSTMREAWLCKVDMQHQPATAVSAMIEYIYTGRLQEDCDKGAVLALAHQYELGDLAEDCAGALLQSLSPANVLRAVQAVKPYRDWVRVRPFWEGIRNAFRAMLADDAFCDDSLSCMSGAPAGGNSAEANKRIRAYEGS